MALDVKAKKNLRKIVRELSKIRGRHTELVSVYVPTGYDNITVIKHLQEEQGTAANIKDKTTRTHVIDSLERMIRQLRLYKRTPENGLAIFAGNASENESKVDIQVWCVEPPEPIKIRMYRCDQTFVLGPLQDMFEYKDVYALIVMDRREATIGLLKGTLISVLSHMTSGVPGKIKAGGQCLALGTLVHLSDGSSKKIEDCYPPSPVISIDLPTKTIKDTTVIDHWFVEKPVVHTLVTTSPQSLVSCSANHSFFVHTPRGIIEKPAKELQVGDFLLRLENKTLLPVALRHITIEKKKTSMVDISTQQENFIANGLLVHNSAARFSRVREGMAIEFYKRICEVCNKEFLPLLKDLKGILVGGPGPTKEEFVDYLNNELKRKLLQPLQDMTYTDESGLHDLVDKSKDSLAKEVITEEKAIMTKFFTLLNKEEGKTALGFEKVKHALETGAVDVVLMSEELDDALADQLEDLAQSVGTEVKVISIETREGVQLRDIGGVAAILRYILQY